ncbi:MAG: aldose 1-epimerase [Caballeronia sp.]|nr:aldose 1-epimerase [Caballeronia sp.]
MTVARPAGNSTPPPASSRPAVPSRRSKLAAATEPPIRPGPATSVVAMGGAGVNGCITLANAQLRLDIAPALGGGITRFDWRSDGALVPIFRPCLTPSAATDPNELACYPLLPYSNRIGGGRFQFLGRGVDVPCNRPGEPLPLHGDGWLGAWDVATESSTHVRLTLDRRHGAPYSYTASQSFMLEASTLVVTLYIENTGRDALPFGRRPRGRHRC